MHVDNLTTQTYLVYFSDFQFLRLLPGLNLNVPDSYVERLKQRLEFEQLIESGLLNFVAEMTDKVHTDQETDVTFIDDSGEKVPVFNASIDGASSAITIGKFFKSPELRTVGLSASNISKLVQQAPEVGWKCADQIISTFELTGKQADAVRSLNFE